MSITTACDAFTLPLGTSGTIKPLRSFVATVTNIKVVATLKVDTTNALHSISTIDTIDTVIIIDTIDTIISVVTMMTLNTIDKVDTM